MKINLKYATVLIVGFLLIVNVCFCVRLNDLGEDIKSTEKETAQLKLQNQDLEKKLFTDQSRQNLNDQAKILGFTKNAEPINLDSLKVALAK
jgi:hypothetical protein